MRLIKFIHSGILINGLKQGSCIENDDILPFVTKNRYTYKNDVLHGNIIVYQGNLDTTISSQTSYVWGHPHDIMRLYFNSGVVHHIINIRYDKRHGLSYMFNTNGLLMNVQNYVNNRYDWNHIPI